MWAIPWEPEFGVVESEITTEILSKARTSKTLSANLLPKRPWRVKVSSKVVPVQD